MFLALFATASLADDEVAARAGEILACSVCKLFGHNERGQCHAGGQEREADRGLPALDYAEGVGASPRTDAGLTLHRRAEEARGEWRAHRLVRAHGREEASAQR